MTLLVVKDLVTTFSTDRGVVRAVDGVSFSLAERSTLGIVGESGCGKSVMSLSIMGLLPSPPGRIERGSIEFNGRDLTKLPQRELRNLRGREIAMIFQEPMSSLNPVFTIGAQIMEAIERHQGLSHAAARTRAIELLHLVGIPAPEERVDAYPHQLSGGMRQRVMIAIALSCDPKLLIADEPTTALDVTIQAQILELLDRLQRELGMSIILITHDLGVIASQVQDVLVMYAGRAVEQATTIQLFERPLHPYTRGLLRSVPSFGDNAQKPRLPTIAGVVPDMAMLGLGCRFRERCDVAIDRCAKEDPPLVEVAGGRRVACFVAVAAEGQS
jgi:oligopeptide/dipeptide ABC transporter ATP-binding protein